MNVIRYSWTLWFVLLLLVGGLGACSGDVSQTELNDSETAKEVALEHSVESQREVIVDASPDSQAEFVREMLPEAGPEVAPETSPEHAEPVPEQAPQPKRCNADEACNMVLDEQGDCAGKCMKQVTTNTCRGEVRHGLCYRKPSTRTNLEQTIAGLLFKPLVVPTHIRVGQSGDFKISLTNTSTQPKSVTFNYEVRPHWQLLTASFKGLTRLEFKANETKILTMKMRGLVVDLFRNDLNNGRMVIFFFDGQSYNLASSVGYGPARENVACGNYYFPKTYCSTPSACTSNYNHYLQAVCCQGVFYPGAVCCTRSDCSNGGSCFEGKCISPRPSPLGNVLPFGHQKVLVVLSNVPGQTHDPSKICTNRYTDLKGLLKLDEFDRYMEKVSQQYMGRKATSYKWWVLTGIKTSDFNPTGKRDIRSMHTALESYLITKGCIKGPNEFDKRYLIDPNVDIGKFGGKASNGGIMVTKRVNVFLFIHELFHTYGADDLYLNLGGKFQLSYDLMADYLVAAAELGVTRGEVRWGDTNANGVIDIFEYAEYPDAIVVTYTSAELSRKDSLEVSASIAATEAGVQKKILVHFINIELPEYKVTQKIRPGDIVAFDGKQVDLNAIRKKGTVTIRVHASYFYTDKSFVRKELKIVTDREVTVKSN